MFQPCDDGLPLRTAVQSFDDVLHVLAHGGNGYAEPFGYSAMDNVNPNLTWNRNPFNGPFDVPAYPWPGRF